jgi:2-C-methyl-D-erythritol 2,4-cyclodiphosphate synthase
MKIGIGYDIHRLVEDRKLFLAGVDIPYIKGLLGYSDGDVVLHAAADAILGALGLGDIGEHFPNTDLQYKDVASCHIARKVVDMMEQKGFAIANIDAVILAEEPKIQPFKNKMTESLAEILKVAKEKVNIKATTNEGVGSIGRGDAIAAYAVVLIEEKR